CFCILCIKARNGVPGSYGGSILNFLRTLHIVFHNGYTSLHSHQQCVLVSFSPHPLQHLLFLAFLIIVILKGLRWYLIVVLIFISLMISNIFSCMCLGICVSSLGKCLFRSSAHLLIRSFG
uniref:Uncharacterized protein n=1 Tax=Ovis aries TaxID=9940 RepID=A0AC11DN04_SHEEP